MSVVATADLLTRTDVRRTAALAVNVITLEHAEAIAEAAEGRGASVIMQLSENAVRYHGGRLRPIATAVHAVAATSSADVALHLDHVTDDALVSAALDPDVASMFGSIMYDAGALPYAENVERTRDVTARAHAAGLLVEAELGYVGGKPDAPASAHAPGVRTDAREAVAFVDATGVDALAVAVGSSHAMTERTARLDLALIAELHDRVPVPLVLHGSSGVPDDELRAAVAAGIAKINVGTALNVALTRAVREALSADGTLVDPRRYLGAGRTAMCETVAALLAVVG